LLLRSIIHYLIDPEGEFVTFYAKSYTAEQMADSIAEHVVKYKQEHPEYHKEREIMLPKKNG
jgi:protein SCO1/2